MAKTCFYCGKELAPGERCSCRGPVSSGSSASSASATRSTSSSSSPKADSSSQASHEEPKNPEVKTEKKKEKKTKQVWNQSDATTKRRANREKLTFSTFIAKVRSVFPSFSKWLRPVMSYIWHPVSSIQGRSQVVPIGKMVIINSLFAALTSLMVLFTNYTDSPFLGMLISLIFGKTNLFTEHPLLAFFTTSAILWLCVLILAFCFMLTSRFANRKLSFLRALDTVTMSSIYLCFADVLIFFSVLVGTRGAFTLIFVALVVMGIAHYVSLKQDLALTDNATFNMLAISYLLFYALAQLGIGIIIRVVTWM